MRFVSYTDFLSPRPADLMRALLLSVVFCFILVIESDPEQKLQAQNLPAQQRRDRVAPPTAVELERWISQLSDPEFLVRETARRKLLQAGEYSLGPLRKHRESVDLELRLGVRDLIAQIPVRWSSHSFSTRVNDLLLAYAGESSPLKKVALIDQLAWWSTAEVGGALLRLAQLEENETLASHAALTLLEIAFRRDQPQGGELTSSQLQTLDTLSLPLRMRFGDFEALFLRSDRWSEKCIGLFLLLPRQKLNEKRLGYLEQAFGGGGTTGQPAAPMLSSSVLRARLIRLAYSRFYTDREHQRLDPLAVSVVNSLREPLAVSICVQTALANRRWEWVEALSPVVSTTVGSAKPLNVSVASTICFQMAEANRLQDREALAETWAEKGRLKLSSGNTDVMVEAIRLRDQGLSYWANWLLGNELPDNEKFSARRLLWAELGLPLAERDADRRPYIEFAEQYLQLPDVSPQHKVRCLLLLAEEARRVRDVEGELEALSAAVATNPISADLLLHWQSRLVEADRDLKSAGLFERVNNAMGAYRDQIRRGNQLLQSDIRAERSLGLYQTVRASQQLAALLIKSHWSPEDAGAAETKDASEKGSLVDLAAIRKMRRDAARRLLETMLRLQPNHAASLATLAECENASGNEEKAAELIRRAIYLQPAEPKFRELLVSFGQEP